MTSLLPPNATALERALAALIGDRIDDMRVPLRDLWSAEHCPEEFLPWLAWALSIDQWDPAWPLNIRRARVASAIAIQRIKGSAQSIQDVIASFGGNVLLREWFQTEPRGIPHTFNLLVTLGGQSADVPSAEFIDAVIAEVSRTKPVRSHFDFVLGVPMRATIGIRAVGRAIVFARLDAVAPEGAPLPAPVFTTLPTIEPEAGEIGDNFAGNVGVASNTTGYTRRWLLSGVHIGSGPNVATAEAGSLVLEVTATGPGGSTMANSAPVIVATPLPEFTEPPSIAPGAGEIGDTFTATDGVATFTTVFTRRWLLSGTAIGTGVTVAPDAAGSLVLEVTATGPGGSTVETTEPVTVAMPAPIFTTDPSIAPTAGFVGDTFTATVGEAAFATDYVRAWLLDGEEIGSGPTVAPTEDGSLVLQITANGPGGSTVATSEAVTVAAAPTEHPWELTDTIVYKDETFILAAPMKVGYALNGQPFIVSDQAGSWIACSTPSELIGAYWAHGAEFDPQILDPGREQGFDGIWGALSGSQAAAITTFNPARNCDPAAAGPFAITVGMCGRLVKFIRKDGLTVPDATWTLLKKRLFINIVPEVPPYGAVSPIYDGAGGVQWVTSVMARKSVLRGCGYVPGQMTLAACKAAGYVPDTDLPFFLNNGEARRPIMANDLWPTGYGQNFGLTFGRLGLAMQAEGADGVDTADFHKLITIGCYGIENARRGNVMRGGAGQNLGMKPLATLVAMATRDAAICADAKLLEGNETHQHMFVTEEHVGMIPNEAGSSGTGYYKRLPFQDVHRGMYYFFHGDQALPPSPLVNTNLLNSDVPNRYEVTSGATGLIGFTFMAALQDGPAGIDGLEFLLQDGPPDESNPHAASIGYWEKYIHFNPNLSSSTEYNAVDKAFYNLVRDLSPVPRLTGRPDVFNPYFNQAAFVWSDADGIHWNYAAADMATEVIDRTDNRLTLDGGRSFYELPDCGTAGSFGVDAANPPRMVDIGVQNRRRSASGFGPWSVNVPVTSPSGTMPNPRFVVQVPGGAGGPATNVQPPQIVQRLFSATTHPLFVQADDVVPAGRQLFAGIGWWSGDLTGGATFEWFVEGASVSTADSYTPLAGDGGIELAVTIGGVTVMASNIVNDVPLTITSPASGVINENTPLAHTIITSRASTLSIRTAAQNAASVDHAQFELAGNVLRWVGNGTKDFEAPQDTSDGGFNTYTVVVRATSVMDATFAEQTITYTVTDVVEGSATFYNFTGANGTGLSTIAGWTLAGGEERLQINGSNALGRRTTTGSSHFYREGVLTSGTQRAGLTFALTGTITPAIAVFAEWISGAFNGYKLYPSNATTLAVRKFVNGVGTTLGSLTVANIVGAWQFEAHDTGSVTELRVFDGTGVQQGATITDSAVDRRASGYAGLHVEGSNAASTTCADDYRGNMQFL